MSDIKVVIFDMYGVLYSYGRFNEELITDIRALRSAVRIGLLSNIGRERLDVLLGQSAIGELFDLKIASSETPYTKPDPRIFELMLDRLDVQKHQALFIDDSADNTAAAQAYGITSHLYVDVESCRGFLRLHGLLR